MKIILILIIILTVIVMLSLYVRIKKPQVKKSENFKLEPIKSNYKYFKPPTTNYSSVRHGEEHESDVQVLINK